MTPSEVTVLAAKKQDSPLLTETNLTTLFIHCNIFILKSCWGSPYIPLSPNLRGVGFPSVFAIRISVASEKVPPLTIDGDIEKSKQEIAQISFTRLSVLPSESLILQSSWPQKSLVQQWSKELTSEGLYGYKPITLQNPKEISPKMDLDNIASVSLFVIDESHNLRHTNGTRFKQLLGWVRNNPKAHVSLLTATPINNELSDITNQILLGTAGNPEVF